MNRFVGECEAYYVGERERSDLLALHLLLLYILILFFFVWGTSSALVLVLFGNLGER